MRSGKIHLLHVVGVVGVVLGSLWGFGALDQVTAVAAPVSASEEVEDPGGNVSIPTDPGTWVSAPTSVAGYTALWDSLDTRYWGAADVSLSVNMGNGRVVWLYGDTFSGNNGMVHSSAILQYGGSLHVSYKGRQLLPNDSPHRIYWVEAAHKVNAHRIKVTAAPISLGKSGVWDFKRTTVKSRVALVRLSDAGNLKFLHWVGYVKAPNPFTDFTALSAHHFTYEKRPHPWANLSNGKVLHTTCQNWDDDVSNHLSGGHLDYSDYRPIFSAENTAVSVPSGR